MDNSEASRRAGFFIEAYARKSQNILPKLQCFVPHGVDA